MLFLCPSVILRAWGVGRKSKRGVVTLKYSQSERGRRRRRKKGGGERVKGFEFDISLLFL